MVAAVLWVCLAICAGGGAGAETTTHARGGYTLILNNNDPTIDAVLTQRMVEAFFAVYPRQAARFNPEAARTVYWIFEPNFAGVASTNGNIITFGTRYLKARPQDIDVVTHEAMHVVQDYRRCPVDGWMTEGLADYARHQYGVNNAAAGWSLPAYLPVQNYTDSYRVTGRFFMWLERRVRQTILTEIDAAARGCAYSNPGTWISLTGQTPEQLWARYAADPAIDVAMAGVNLALNRPVTADSACGPDEGPAKAVNGSWSGGLSDKWCSLGAAKWLQIDLGISRWITSITLRHAGAGGESAGRNTRAFDIQLSSDGHNWSRAVNVTDNAASVSTHTVGAIARHVRLNVIVPEQDTGGAARIYELEVY
jgi:hypothetical protein